MSRLLFYIQTWTHWKHLSRYTLHVAQTCIQLKALSTLSRVNCVAVTYSFKPLRNVESTFLLTGLSFYPVLKFPSCFMTVLHKALALRCWLQWTLSKFRFSCSCWHPSWSCSWSVQLTHRSWFSRSWVWRHRIVIIQTLGTEGTSTGDCSPLTLLQQRCDNQTSHLVTFC